MLAVGVVMVMKGAVLGRAAEGGAEGGCRGVGRRAGELVVSKVAAVKGVIWVDAMEWAADPAAMGGEEVVRAAALEVEVRAAGAEEAV